MALRNFVSSSGELRFELEKFARLMPAYIVTHSFYHLVRRFATFENFPSLNTSKKKHMIFLNTILVTFLTLKNSAVIAIARIQMSN
ncbi:hypothetical protein BpHYR1_033197 [Brachionus plicatilis]|uniref:Uncharacterized protein n=1 Tax=Brachionus plicatilis TaxID=10195 RepID=A0A3M7QNE3_BRAPC|nr:hypothetical protein BpHYR1_033197 [Brachionus plicatilis]